MNEHDSEKIAGIFNNDGMTKSEDIDNADDFLLIHAQSEKMRMINYMEH